MFDVETDTSHCHVSLLISPFGFTSYRGSSVVKPTKVVKPIISTTYFIGPGRGAHANSEVLTISTQDYGSSSVERKSNNKCDSLTFPKHPLGPVSGYNLQVGTYLIDCCSHYFFYQPMETLEIKQLLLFRLSMER